MTILKCKKQRTVYRLTLVQGHNMDNVNGYAKLVTIGAPSFIEIKGVTYSGASESSTLTMKNCPFHYEVREFAEALKNTAELQALNYEMACEHEHSCCVLIAKRDFLIQGKWHTWIDFPKFQLLLQRYYEN